MGKVCSIPGCPQIAVKHKEMFNPPPFQGQGLDIRQVRARMAFYKDTGMRCLFLVIDASTGMQYWQWLDELENTKYFDTRNSVRIYNVSQFNILSAPGQMSARLLTRG